MKRIKFAHLSDTHICKDYCNSQMKDLFSKCESPAENLKKCYAKLESQRLDFVLISGDLVHEGTEEDYRYLKEIADTFMPTTKIIYCLGNHDRKQEFRKGMGMEDSNNSYYKIEEINGFRILIMDSAVAGKEEGTITEEQVEWLADVTKSCAPNGSILVMHHPITWELKEMGMPVNERFRDILINSDILGIFCGHTHFNSIDYVDNIAQYTTESMAFGIAFEGETISFVEKTGYNICQIQDNRIQIHNEISSPEAKTYATIDLKVMMAAMK